MSSKRFAFFFCHQYKHRTTYAKLCIKQKRIDSRLNTNWNLDAIDTFTLRKWECISGTYHKWTEIYFPCYVTCAEEKQMRVWSLLVSGFRRARIKWVLFFVKFSEWRRISTAVSAHGIQIAHRELIEHHSQWMLNNPNSMRQKHQRVS